MQNISRYKSFGKFVPIMLFMRRWSDEKKRRGNKINRLHSFIMHCRGSRKKQKKNGKLGNYSYPSVLVYICASLLQLTVESRDLSQAETNVNFFHSK